MSKPLVFVLQLIGAIVFLMNAGKAFSGDFTGAIIGLMLVFIPGIFLRKRFK